MYLSEFQALIGLLVTSYGNVYTIMDSIIFISDINPQMTLLNVEIGVAVMSELVYLIDWLRGD